MRKCKVRTVGSVVYVNHDITIPEILIETREPLTGLLQSGRWYVAPLVNNCFALDWFNPLLVIINVLIWKHDKLNCIGYGHGLWLVGRYPIIYWVACFETDMGVKIALWVLSIFSCSIRFSLYLSLNENSASHIFYF